MTLPPPSVFPTLFQHRLCSSLLTQRDHERWAAELVLLKRQVFVCFSMRQVILEHFFLILTIQLLKENCSFCLNAFPIPEKKDFLHIDVYLSSSSRTKFILCTHLLLLTELNNTFLKSSSAESLASTGQMLLLKGSKWRKQKWD